MASNGFQRLGNGDKRGTADSSTLPSIILPNRGPRASGQVDYFAIKPAATNADHQTPGSDVTSPFTPSPSLFPLPPPSNNNSTVSSATNLIIPTNHKDSDRLSTQTVASATSANSHQPLLQSPPPVFSPASSNGAFPYDDGADDGDPRQAKGRMHSENTTSHPAVDTSFDFGLHLTGDDGSSDNRRHNRNMDNNNVASSNSFGNEVDSPISPPPPPYARAKTTTTFTGFRPYSIHSDTYSYIADDDELEAERNDGIHMMERGQRTSTGGTMAAMKLGGALDSDQARARRAKKKKWYLGCGLFLGLVVVALVIGFVVGIMGMFSDAGTPDDGAN